MLRKRMMIAAIVVGLLMLLPAGASAQRRKARVVRKGPRTTIVVHRNHPIRRKLPATVVVRPARRTVVVGAPIRFLPPVLFVTTVVPLPAKEHLIWQDSESVYRDEEWVDLNFGVDDRGNALYLGIDGRSQLNFAEVTFDNGEVQVVDFEDRVRPAGVYRMLDFANGRRVSTVRLLARAQSDEATFRVYLSR